MGAPLISVIVPVYNAEKYLEDCVQSILTQTHQPVEVILVDDGSPDNCPAMCDAMAQRDARVRVLHKANGGVSSARNAGLNMAQGEYISFVDSDDMLFPDALATLLRLAEQHHADICSAQSVGLSADGVLSERLFSGAVEVWQGEESLQKMLEDHPATYSAWAKLYTRTILTGIRFAEDVRIHEDSLFVFDCICKKPAFVSANLGLYQYRDTPQSASRGRFHEKYLDILTVAQRKLARIRAEVPACEDLAKNLLVKANMALLHSFCKTYDSAWQQQERECLRTVRKYGQYFIPAISSDLLFFRVIRYRLYWLYKLRSYWRNKHLY